MVAQNDLRDFSSHSCRLPSNAIHAPISALASITDIMFYWRCVVEFV